MASHQQYVDKLAGVIRKFPSGGGPKFDGQKVMWRGKRRISIADATEFSVESTVPKQAAVIVLGIQLANKKAVAASGLLAKGVSLHFGWNLSFQHSAELGAFLLSCLIKTKLYRLQEFGKGGEKWIRVRDKAVLEFSERDIYTAHKPFPHWTGLYDEEGRQLVNHSYPQLDKTKWHPEPHHFFGTGWDDKQQEMTLPEYRLTARDKKELSQPKLWVKAIHQTESTGYSINGDMLQLVSAIADDPKRCPPSTDKKMARQYKRLREQYEKEQPKKGAWAKLKKKNERTYKHLDYLKGQDDKAGGKKDTWDKELQDLRIKYKNKIKPLQTALESIESKHRDFVSAVKRSKQLAGKPYYHRAFCDYRGRIYTSRSIINYQKGDLNRGLIQLEKGKPIRKSDWRYLWIHIANMYGIEGDIKKREAEARKLEPKILRWGRKPLATYHEWSSEADEKWQFIRACFEVVALKQNPRHKSQLIIEADQSTSCLQHMALIRGDQALAERLNMGARYNDLYQDIASKSETLKDVAPVKRRKIVKDAVTAWSYGGNHYSVVKKYHQSEMDYLQGLTAQERWDLAVHVIKLIEYELDAAKDYTQAMKFDAVTRLNSSQQSKKFLHWKTISGFEVYHYHQDVQKYRPRMLKSEKRTANGRKEYTRLTYWEPVATVDDQSRRKLIKATPPNWLHSVDATVMHFMLDWASRKDISIAPIHDAIGTHIRDMEIVMEAFRRFLASVYRDADPVRFWKGEQVPIEPRIDREWVKTICRSPNLFS